jgi:predicted ferric reductase
MLATSSTTLWYSTRATGIVALVLLTATMVLGILTAGRVRTRSWPAFAQADLHKRVSILAMVFLAIHVLTAILDTYVHLGWASIVVPFSSSYQPFWTGLGAVAVDLMIAVAVSSALRQRISARTWRGIHWVAYGSWPVAMAHSLGEGTDAAKLWMDALAAVCTLAVGGALAWRVADHRRARDLAARVGASTRAVHDPAPAPRSAAPTLADGNQPTTEQPHRAGSATRLLEKDRQ